MYRQHFAYLFICPWTLGLLSAIVNNASMNTDVQQRVLSNMESTLAHKCLMSQFSLSLVPFRVFHKQLETDFEEQQHRITQVVLSSTFNSLYHFQPLPTAWSQSQCHMSQVGLMIPSMFRYQLYIFA